MWNLKEYRIATTAQEAVAMMNKGPGKGAYIAGGTDMFLTTVDCDYVVDINQAGMSDIARTPAGDLFLGAAATLHNVATNPLVTDFAEGLLSGIAAHCGNRPVRSTATIGGNICNALPSADMAPVLLALDAMCYVTDEESQESMPLTDFFVAPRLTVLEGRLLVGMSLPAEAGVRSCASYKLTRSAEDISLVQVVVALGIEDGRIEAARIALGAVAPVPMRATLAEAQLVGKSLAEITPEIIADAAGIAAGECEPLDDHRASAEYRRDMVRVLTRRQIMRALHEFTNDSDEEGTVA
jgi:carbon-monoxide dehydrogenase medium subunit